MVVASGTAASSGSLGLAGRRDLYALAARVFAAEIDEPLYRHFSSALIETLCRKSGLVFIEPELAALGADRAVEELAVEYCRLFIGPQPRCTPYASAARGEALLGGRARTELESLMRSRGISLADEARIASPDHAAVELSVLAHAYGDGDESGAAGFLRDHVLPWMPSFLAAVEGESRRDLYRSVARLTAALLAEERELHEI